MLADIPQALREQQLREQQLQFANHLRNPELFPAPAGIDERRLQVYRQLFFSNISNLLASTFPVIRSILSDMQWQALVRDFYTQHRCETPLFPLIAGEFAAYLQYERDGSADYPFLVELALYEWSEIALRHSGMSRADVVLHSGKPQLSLGCWPLVFRFPVHRIGVTCLPQEPPASPTCLLLVRDENGHVRFIESNSATFRLLHLLGDERVPDLHSIGAQLAAELQHPDLHALEAMLATTVEQLLQAGVLVINP